MTENRIKLRDRVQLTSVGEMLERLRDERGEDPNDPGELELPVEGIAEIEVGLLSGLMTLRDGPKKALTACRDAGLRPEDFFRKAHGVIYRAVARLLDGDWPADALNVVVELKSAGELEAAGGAVAVSMVEAAVGSPAIVPAYARRVVEDSRRRRLAMLGGELRQRAANSESVGELVAQAQREMAEIVQEESAFTFRGAKYIEEYQVHIQDIFEGRAPPALKTKIVALDNITDGLSPGNLVVIAGRPGMGKSMLATSIADNVAHMSRKHVAVFTAEMDRFEVMDRIISKRAKVNIRDVKLRRAGTETWSRLASASAQMAECGTLTVVDRSAPTLAFVRSEATKLRERGELDLMIVDYLQLMETEEKIDNPVQKITVISNGLKALARDLGVPIIALAQLNRSVESRNDKRPMMADLRESGAIEQDADKIIFLYREEYYLKDKTDDDNRGIVEANLSKNRGGPTGIVRLRYVPEIALIGDAARETDPAMY